MFSFPMKQLVFLLCCLFVLSCFLCGVTSWGRNDGNERVLLKDVQAITLYEGKRTTGRRNPGVPQLKCVGGTAGCSAFNPKVVQCKNAGFDGFDVQWECKTDMDDSYRFGRIQVSCEGYEYPDDPYILKGSCGLEYTIDYTEAGKSRQNSWGGSSYNTYAHHYNKTSGGSWFIFIIMVVGIIFLIRAMGRSNSPRPSAPPSDDDHRGHNNRGGSPPPYGFKPDYTRQDAPPPYNDSTAHGYSSNSYQTHHSTHTNYRPGFWSGMGLGSVAGYLFGSRNTHYGGGYGYGGYNRGYNTGYGGFSSGYGSSYGGGSSWDSSSWGSGSSTRARSSGTSRTASGFGGTSRR